MPGVALPNYRHLQLQNFRSGNKLQKNKNSERKSLQEKNLHNNYFRLKYLVLICKRSFIFLFCVFSEYVIGMFEVAEENRGTMEVVASNTRESSKEPNT